MDCHDKENTPYAHSCLNPPKLCEKLSNPRESFQPYIQCNFVLEYFSTGKYLRGEEAGGFCCCFGFGWLFLNKGQHSRKQCINKAKPFLS